MTESNRFEYHPIATYSSLLEWLQSLTMRSASPSQWLATINSAKGIRTDEIVRSELITFLDQFKESLKITKSQLMEVAEYALSTCKISIQTEVAKAYRPTLQSKRFTREEIPKRLTNSFTKGEIISCIKLTSFNYKMIGLRFNTSLFGIIDSWFVFDDRWKKFKPFRSYKTPVEAIDFLYSAAIAKFSQHRSHASRNHYERYALLGIRRSYKEWIISIPNWTGIFNDAHFDVENTIIHLRTSEWKDNDGKPLFLVDEIQSDWHAMGRSNGYYYDSDDSINEDESDLVPDAPYIKEWHELGIKIATALALQSGHTRVAFTTGNVHCARYGNDLDGFYLLYDQLIPKALEKIAAKFKCNLSQSTITTSTPKHTLRNLRDGGWELNSSVKGELETVIRNEEVAIRFMQSRGQKKLEEVRVLEISPALADIVKKKGLPLFGWW